MNPPSTTPLALKVLAVLGALVVVPGGAFLAAANVPTGGKVAIGVAVAWWVVTSAVLGKTLLSRRPDVRTPVRVALALAAVASATVAFIVTRDTTVDEEIVTATETRPPDAGREAPPQNTRLLAGEFSGESGHRGKGDAVVVGLAEGGRVLTFSDFDVDPGAGGLRVYLHEGKTTSDDLGDFVEIAGLKGNKGDQQYRLPADLDLRRYSTVVIWCVPFSTRIAQAPLS